MTVFSTLLSLIVSAFAISYLASTDPKRRRAFKLPEYEGTRRARLAVAITFVPGLLLALMGIWSGFVVWMAGITVLGWGIAAISPVWAKQVEARVRERGGERLERVISLVASFKRFMSEKSAAAVQPQPVGPSELEQAKTEIELLKQRVEALEAQIAKPKRARPSSRQQTKTTNAA